MDTGNHSTLPLYILAGGQSSRFGQEDKARARFDDQALILGVARALAPATSGCVVVAATQGRYDDLGLATIADLRGGLGPLAGLERALEHALEGGHAWVAVAACDMVGLEAQWVSALFEHAHDPTQAVVYGAPDERPQPLLAIYHVNALERVRAQLDQGVLAMWRLLLTLETTTLSPPDDWSNLLGINTQEELRAATEASSLDPSEGRDR